MNPGQLLVAADEFGAVGNQAQAQAALRALVSRFPDHQLAAVAANRMSGGQPSGTTVANAATARGANSPLPTSNANDCESQLQAMRKRVALVNGAPITGALATIQRQMWVNREGYSIASKYCSTVQPYASELPMLQTNYQTLVKSCEQLSAGSVCSGPNASY